MTVSPPSALPYKISTLVYITNASGEVLLLQRRKAPNAGLWSPIGGKLEMGSGESPFEAACRETAEETGLIVTEADLHLFGMIAEKNYEDRTHWLMFLFHCRKHLEAPPPPIDEGAFAFIPTGRLPELAIPETDRLILWPLFLDHRDRFTALRADCAPGRPIKVDLEERIGP